MRKQTRFTAGSAVVEEILTQVNSYKQSLQAERLRDKIDMLTAPFPRFLWIIRTLYQGRPVWDSVFDGTAVYPEVFRTIYFE